MKFRNMYTYVLSSGERNSLPSVTVPDQTLSLKELVSRYTRGQSVEQFSAVYTDDPDLTGLVGLDAVERVAALRSVKDVIRRARKAESVVDAVPTSQGPEFPESAPLQARTE